MTSDALPAKATALEIAAGWFALRRSGTMTAQMLFELEVWLESDPAHLVAYKDVSRTWALTHAVATDPEILALREEAYGDNRLRRRLIFTVASALGVSAALAVAVWLSGAIGLWRDWMSPVAEQHFRTAVGETRSVILPDGSAVTLDSNTELDVRETWRARSLKLARGQAFFLVAQDADRPFAVAAAGNVVTATGTAFDIRVDPDRFSVLLSEGRLHVLIPETANEPSEQTDMEPGWKLTALAGGERTLIRLSQADEARALGWRTGQLAFVARPIAEIAAELNRYSARKLEVAPELAPHPIDGVFRAGDIDGFVRILVASGLARVEKDTGASVRLASRRKSAGRVRP